MSKSVTSLPARLSWMLRIEPFTDGPPAANTVFTSVLSELTVYTPGRLANPTTNTCTDRSCPSEAERSKLR